MNPEPPPTTHPLRVAQLVEHPARTGEAAGSGPAAQTMDFRQQRSAICRSGVVQLAGCRALAPEILVRIQAPEPGCRWRTSPNEPKGSGSAATAAASKTVNRGFESHLPCHDRFTATSGSAPGVDSGMRPRGIRDYYRLRAIDVHSWARCGGDRSPAVTRALRLDRSTRYAPTIASPSPSSHSS